MYSDSPERKIGKEVLQKLRSLTHPFPNFAYKTFNVGGLVWHKQKKTIIIGKGSSRIEKLTLLAKPEDTYFDNISEIAKSGKQRFRSYAALRAPSPILLMNLLVEQKTASLRAARDRSVK